MAQKLYRYKLSNSKKNEGISKRKINGITLHSKRWIYSEKPLFTKTYGMIDMERVDDIHDEDHTQVSHVVEEDSRPSEAARIIEESMDSTEVVDSQEDSVKLVVDFQPEDTEIDPSSMTASALQIALINRGFVDREVIHHSQRYLSNLYQLDKEIEKELSVPVGV